MEAAFKTYMSGGKTSQLKEVNKEQTNKLYDVFAMIDREELACKVEVVESANRNSQHGAAWKLINDISGRNSSQTSTLKANSPEERVQLWHTHFSNLLGNPPVISDQDTPIDKVFDSLPIHDGPFTNKEFAKAKGSLKCGKACGEDGITSEFLEYGGLDDIVLDFINKAFTTGELPT